MFNHLTTRLGRPTFFLRVIGIGLLMATSLPASAAAAAPDVQTLPIDTTFTPPLLSAACGFPVVRHVEGLLTIQTFYDGAGNFKRESDAYRLTETLTANGVTLVGQTRQTIIVSLHDDGSFSVAYMGTDFRLPVSGSGISFGSAGRYLELYATDGSVQVTQDVGDARADFYAICQALAT